MMIIVQSVLWLVDAMNVCRTHDHWDSTLVVATLLQSSETLHCKHTTTQIFFHAEPPGTVASSELQLCRSSTCISEIAGCRHFTDCAHYVLTCQHPLQSSSAPADTEPIQQKDPRSSRRDLPVLVNPTVPNRTAYWDEGESHEAPPTSGSKVFNASSTLPAMYIL